MFVHDLRRLSSLAKQTIFTSIIIIGRIVIYRCKPGVGSDGSSG
jgi:hypothetical protein